MTLPSQIYHHTRLHSHSRKFTTICSPPPLSLSPSHSSSSLLFSSLLKPLPTHSFTHTHTHRLTCLHTHGHTNVLAVQFQLSGLLALSSPESPGTWHLAKHTHSSFVALMRSLSLRISKCLPPQTAFQTHPCPSLSQLHPDLFLLRSDN